MHHPQLDEMVRRDPRYTYEAYEFVFAALDHTLRMLGRVPQAQEGAGERDRHVSGAQLLEGVRDLALREFGLMARTVFRAWGINCTADIGEIVFNLVAANLMKKTAEDSRDDFRDVYDLDQVLVRDYRIDVKEEVEEGS
ncbi:MAG TPA: Minf_1886 family protein [Gemmataceae bacterium]|nr:Minf_1886 family protein [Gemmataceae bacterium]